MAFNNGSMPPPPPGGMPPPPPGAPRPPMATGAMPPPPGAPMGAPRPPMPTGAMPPPPGAPMGAPRPPMPTGAMPPPGAPMGAPKPPMPTGAMPPPGAPMGAPRPPMGPGMTPPPGAPMGGAPRPMGPGMAPGAGPSFGAQAPMGAPRPMGGPSFGSPSGPGMAPGAGPSFGGGFGQPGMADRAVPVNAMGEFGDTQVTLDSFLSEKKGYRPTRSAISKSRVSYEQYCSELTFDFFNSILNGQNLLEKKSEINNIKKYLVFALTNTKDLPDRQRDILYNAAIRFVDFLKAVVYYPEKNIVNDEIIAYMPILKDAAHAFRGFLLKNR